MTWEFLAIVLVVVVVPGADMVLILRSTIAAGRAAGLATLAGVFAASALQGSLAAVGVGALIVQNQWLFETIRLLGIAFLAYLGISAIAAALRRQPATKLNAEAVRPRYLQAMSQGFLTNITNPKMFVFYLSLLPQFVAPGAPVSSWLVHAWAMPVLGSLWMLIVIAGASVLRERLLRPLVRRVIDGVSGLALLGFGVRLATSR